MTKEQDKLVSGKAQVICLLLAFLFFLFMWWILPEFVPAQDPVWAKGFAALGAAMFGGLFWLASMCFTVVLVDMNRRKHKSCCAK